MIAPTQGKCCRLLLAAAGSRPYADAPPDRVAAAMDVYADAADASQVSLRSAGEVTAAVDAPSLVLSAAEEATAHPLAAPRGRLEQRLARADQPAARCRAGTGRR
jgi:hypothetical protein